MNGERRTTNRRPGLRCAFTLIELLIVLLVISILAAMMFPVLLKAKTWGREKQAAIEVRNIEIAIRGYRASYGKWPAQTQAATDACFVADNSPVISALLTNPRSMVFLQLQQSSLSTNPDTAGSCLDPWMHPYIIALDYSGDNRIAVNADGVAVTNGTNIAVTLTNLNNKVTSNTLNFVAEIPVGVMSWGNRDTALKVNQDNYLNQDLCSWQMGMKTK